jgi:hypothetical protein
LYSADRVVFVTGAPHSLQNLAFALSSVPHDPHNSPDAVMSRGHPTVVPRHCHRWPSNSCRIAAAILTTPVKKLYAWQHIGHQSIDGRF